ncbi:type II toxin-antitoxin system VapC family toxin [Chroococcidiopsis thermalis]|uniref:PilT protein domain protein n=1 Tax=Chroococcidiopsis thermalis (strain PCC 7203) TaxID=251229 RepID=K9TWD8_CHRTP|nr:type II toxin-antitoxin system VapC family toxin [Chroococcidiopsis thermalis]AFY86875.1 PilT protein domain protein [Chroococcidiopsis thermalis PCC 7203]PSB42194.1 type II toxin-antitoxin system VapC family toxin [Cyanosarcina cf. burmensis CCALA 770]
MRILLDTHSFLWFIEGSPNLSNIARSAIEDRKNQRFLSVASLWEMSIKVSIGKLELEMTFAELVQREVYGNAIELLEIQPEHLDELAKLPFHHKDPFDRLIIAQSLAECIPVVTKDEIFGSYPVTILR